MKYDNCEHFKDCCLRENGECPKDCIDYDD